MDTRKNFPIKVQICLSLRQLIVEHLDLCIMHPHSTTRISWSASDCGKLICRETEWPTQDHRGNVLQLYVTGMPVKELCWPWYKAEVSLNHREKTDFSFFFPNTAEQTPSKYQGSVSFQKHFPFDKRSKPDIILVLVFLLVETKCSNPVCLQYSQAAGDRFLKACLIISTSTILWQQHRHNQSQWSHMQLIARHSSHY